MLFKSINFIEKKNKQEHREKNNRNLIGHPTWDLFFALRSDESRRTQTGWSSICYDTRSAMMTMNVTAGYIYKYK